MAGKIRAKLIMELREQNMSRRGIAQTRHMSMDSVCEVFGIAEERGIGWGQVRELPEEEVYRLFYPDRHVRESPFEEPDWDYVHREMAKVGVNLRLLHDEYRERCAREHKVAMGYTRFCEGYGDHVAANNLTKRIQHKAGVSCEVDWSGPTLGKGQVNPVTGEVSRIYLFVGVLPFSQMAYFEPTLDMKERTWLRCHVHMYEYWGGVPERTVCDNLKTGVVKHPREGEIVLNDAYEALGEHYMTAIMPAQVRKPKQKASAGGTVRDAATWVIAELRNEAFATIEDARAAVARCLDAYNAHPFQKREGRRESVYREVEAAELRSLPDVRYERRRVGLQPLGQPRLPRRLRQEPLLRALPLRGTEGRPQGRRVHPRNPPRRRAHRHPQAAPLVREELLLDRPRPHARLVREAGVGRRAHPPVGAQGRSFVRRGHRADLRSRQAQGAGLQPGAVGAQALEEVRRREARGRLRARAAEADVAAVQTHQGDPRLWPGRGAGGTVRGETGGGDRRPRPWRRLLQGAGVIAVIDEETRRKLREMSMGEMVEALDLQEADRTCMGMPFDERVRMMVDHAHEVKRASSVSRLTQRARLRFPDAEPGEMIYEGRGIDGVLVREALTCQFMDGAANVIVEGCTGTGNYAEKRIMSGNGLPPQVIRSRQPRPFA